MTGWAECEPGQAGIALDGLDRALDLVRERRATAQVARSAERRGAGRAGDDRLGPVTAPHRGDQPVLAARAGARVPLPQLWLHPGRAGSQGHRCQRAGLSVRRVPRPARAARHSPGAPGRPVVPACAAARPRPGRPGHPGVRQPPRRPAGGHPGGRDLGYGQGPRPVLPGSAARRRAWRRPGAGGGGDRASQAAVERRRARWRSATTAATVASPGPTRHAAWCSPT